LRLRALAAALGALGGAMPAAGGAPTPALNIQVSGTGAPHAPCAAQVDGQRILMRDFPAFARRWRGRTGHMTLAPDSGFRCFYDAILKLHRMGMRIGFISEPPAPVE